MKDIIFACPWGKDKKKSWSGTHYNIYQRLEKEFNIIDFDYGEKNKQTFFRLKTKVLRVISLIFRKDYHDMRISTIVYFKRKAKKIFRIGNYVCLCFEECPDMKNIHSYVYQDLCVGYIKYLFDYEKQIFKVSGFQDNNEKNINKREKLQRDYLINRVEGIFTMGKWYTHWLTESYGVSSSKIHHVGGGCNIDITKIDYSIKTGNKILFIGRDFIRKNGNLVVEAFKLAQRQRQDIELYIAGPVECPLSATGKNIYFLGEQDYSKLPELFNKCDIFCMPSKFEAYGLVFVEALIYGLPCIGRNAYEMPYFIQDKVTGYLLKEETPEELSKYMLDLLSNQQIKSNVRDKFEWYIKEYSWDSVVDRMKKVIEQDNFYIKKDE